MSSQGACRRGGYDVADDIMDGMNRYGDNDSIRRNRGGSELRIHRVAPSRVILVYCAADG